VTMVEDRVSEALGRLIAAGTLSPDQAEAVRHEVDARPAPDEPRRNLGRALAEVGGYVGAAFVFAAIAVFTGAHWDDLNKPEQVLLFAGPALLLVAGAVLADRAGTAVAHRLAAALLFLAGGLLPGVTWVLIGRDDGWAWSAVWGTAALAWALAYGYARGIVLHVPTLVAACVAAALVLDQLTSRAAGPDDAPVPFWTDYGVGLAIIAVALAWAVLAWFGLLRERALGLTLAGAALYAAGQEWAWAVLTWPGYLVLGVLAGLGLAGYLRTRITGVLIVGVVALATVVPQAVLEYTDGALGTAGGLLVAGLSIVAASILGLRLRRAVSVQI
jgi:hypothetical protein